MGKLPKSGLERERDGKEKKRDLFAKKGEEWPSSSSSSFSSSPTRPKKGKERGFGRRTKNRGVGRESLSSFAL